MQRSSGAASSCTGCDIDLAWEGSDHVPVWATFSAATMTSEGGFRTGGLDLESRMRFSQSKGKSLEYRAKTSARHALQKQ